LRRNRIAGATVLKGADLPVIATFPSPPDHPRAAA